MATCICDGCGEPCIDLFCGRHARMVLDTHWTQLRCYPENSPQWWEVVGRITRTISYLEKLWSEEIKVRIA